MKTATVPIEQTWKVEDMFADAEDFRSQRAELQRDLVGLERFRGHLGDSATALAEALETISEAVKRLMLLRSYTGCLADGDISDDTYQTMRQEVDLLATELFEHIAYVRPEILTLPAEQIEAFLDEEPRLAPHAHYLRDLLRERPHVLSTNEERIMASASSLMRTPGDLYQILNNVELPRPEVTLRNGETVRLGPVEIARHRTTSVREDRQKLFPAYFGAYGKMKDSLGQNLYGALKAHHFRASMRNYESCLDAALSPENIPAAVYHNLIGQVREHLPVLWRYFRLRAQALGLEQLQYCDLHCPLTDEPAQKYSPDEAVGVIENSLAPLGEAYVTPLRQAFEQRWIDWHPRTGKRSGAYANGRAYDVHPYVLMNYQGDYDSVSTLAHEMGHAMHSFFSNRTQPFSTADYSIFVAEVASILNETLLNHRLRAEAGPAERLALLSNHLDGVRGTLFRQTMFAEFELAIHEQVDRGEPLTGDSLNRLYLKLLREYHGHDEGVVHISEDYAVEWAGIPHFYYNFYVYQYATGLIAAHALVQALRDEPQSAQQRYLEFLGSGGSDYPLALLRRAGVDLESAEPYRAALEGLSRDLDELEGLLAASAGGAE